MGLSRQEVAESIDCPRNALASGSEIELSAGGDTLKLGVASHVDRELELEIDGDETELEMEIKWTDDPSGNAKRNARPAHRATATRHPLGRSCTGHRSRTGHRETRPTRRGRPRKIAAT